jgi:transcriptional regulator with AAA-type ATPase domain
MRFLCYTTDNKNDTNPSIVELDSKATKVQAAKLLAKGTLILLADSDRQLFKSVFTDVVFIDLGIKDRKVELFRSFKLPTLQSNGQPRLLMAYFNSLAAFKRSFNAFRAKRYNPQHPCCVLSIPDGVLRSLQADSNLKVSYTDADLFNGLVVANDNAEIVQKMSKVLLGDSYEMRFLRTLMLKASKCDLAVLILGESGTGKDVIANLIHQNSTRSKEKMVTVNCAAIPDSLFESEVFGHEKGSFTGAVSNKVGLLEAANDSTIFLDEIGDLSLNNQSKLLLALENNEILPVGATTTKKINVRIIAATNRHLVSMIRQERFREDLYYRLNGITMLSPPLRERVDDIPLIANAIWKEKMHNAHELNPAFLDGLKSLPWMGNVRELKIMLNSIHDIFGESNPGAAHLLSMLAYQKKIHAYASHGSEGNRASNLKVDSNARLIEVQNTLWAIRKGFSTSNERKMPLPKSFSKSHDWVSLKQNLLNLERLCAEPIYFKSTNLFEEVVRFQAEAMVLVEQAPKAVAKLGKAWDESCAVLYKSIDNQIYDLVWKPSDL